MTRKILLILVLCLLASPLRAGEAGTAHDAIFHGFHCKQDCVGHRAGYKWAEKHGITDPAQCRAKGKSFNEGCIAYARELQEAVIPEHKNEERRD
jgi:hypothetical protein